RQFVNLSGRLLLYPRSYGVSNVLLRGHERIVLAADLQNLLGSLGRGHPHHFLLSSAFDPSVPPLQRQPYILLLLSGFSQVLGRGARWGLARKILVRGAENGEIVQAFPVQRCVGFCCMILAVFGRIREIF